MGSAGGLTCAAVDNGRHGVELTRVGRRRFTHFEMLVVFQRGGSHKNICWVVKRYPYKNVLADRVIVLEGWITKMDEFALMTELYKISGLMKNKSKHSERALPFL